MPIAVRQAISCTSLLSLALPAALFASLAQANIPENSVASLEERVVPASRVVRQSARPAANDSLLLQARTDANQNNAEQALAASAEAHPALIEDHGKQPATDEHPVTASEPSSRPALSSPPAHDLSPARLLTPTPGKAGTGAAHDEGRAVSSLSPIIDLAEPPTGWWQTRHDFKALGVPSLRHTHHGIPSARAAVTDAAGDRRWERNVELKYVAHSDLVWPASTRLQAGLAS
ncbi:hypothetical protein [Pseudomonas sp. CNPSo 3701]|uniref:hypothetical protein n=1 Tax=Pseudomonas sp. CNPSo 3701 TaxID=3027943 RepID=UPI002363B12D|nr:hypothetical protein [Pseudomonas sp. CNPSo 3701]MDD1509730.1 hypothetical protein [Pseudomonas sp. CNPSo 3701]